GKFSYGFNWGNVRKRFLTQIITKGLFCQRWGTRIVAVVQEDLFDTFHAHSAIVEVNLAQSNIVFMLYQYSRSDDTQPWTFSFQRAVPTTHANLMNQIMYEASPEQAVFERKILDRI